MLFDILIVTGAGYAVFAITCAEAAHARRTRLHLAAMVVVFVGLALAWISELICSRPIAPSSWTMQHYDVLSLLVNVGLCAAGAGATVFVAADSVLAWRARRRLFPFFYRGR